MNTTVSGVHARHSRLRLE